VVEVEQGEAHRAPRILPILERFFGSLGAALEAPAQADAEILEPQQRAGFPRVRTRAERPVLVEGKAAEHAVLPRLDSEDRGGKVVATPLERHAQAVLA